MLTVREEVTRLLNDMKQAAITAHDPKALCQSIGIETRVRELALPDEGQVGPELISPYAQAVIARVWREDAERNRKAA